MKLKLKSPFSKVSLRSPLKYQETPYAKTIPKINGPYTKIYLIRHCHPDYTVKDTLGDKKMPLSELGKKQRKLLNKKLDQIKLDKVYTSDFTRARETAEDWAHKNKKKIFTNPRLDEIDWTDWYKIKYFRMSESTRVKKIHKYRKLDTEIHKLHGKARRTLAEIYKENKGKRVGLFCHGNIIRVMVTSILHTDIIGFLSLEIYQSSVTKLVIDRDGYIKVNYINNISHLPNQPDEDLFLAALNQ